MMRVQQLCLTLFIISVVILNCRRNSEHLKNETNPNIIFILVDDMGYSDLGSFGSEIRTPRLDYLAENGIRFTQMHNAGKCFPSRASLLTGQYAQKVDMQERARDFRNAVMFGRVLKNVGYRTLYIGKHHGTDNPFEWGFDHYWGLLDGAASYFNPGLQRPGEPVPAQGTRPDRPLGRRVFVFDDTVKQPYTPPPGYYATTAWTDWALELLKRYEDEDNPFLLYLSYQVPHDPLQALEEDILKYEGVYDVGYDHIARARHRRQVESGLLDPQRYPRSEPTYREWELLSPEERRDQVQRMQVYAAMIDCLDQNIGRLIDYLKSRGELDNTLILFASDNGANDSNSEGFGDVPIGSMESYVSLGEDWANVTNTPFRYFKNYSHQGGIATPFIAYWPKGISESGRVDHSLLHFVDIMPTFLDITGAPYPSEYRGDKVGPVDGVSLLPLFRGGQIQRHAPLFYDWDQGSAIQTDEWKLVRWKDEWKLFDMQKDRTETTNVLAEHPRVAGKLKSKWQEWIVSTGVDPEMFREEEREIPAIF